MATPTDNKRQRHSVYTTSNSSLQLLTDLPGAILPTVASFLPRVSCVSFAMAMTKQQLDGISSHIPSAISIAIVTASSESWESIDFKDIQEGVYGGRSLTDNDIRWVLLCIDAQNKIKSFKFTNCVGITGRGLESIRESVVLERIDLSLVGDYENPNIDPEPPISAAVVIPILTSILNTQGNSLVHVQLPKKWRVERSNILRQFLERLDRVLNQRRFQCSKGCGICEGSEDFPSVNQRRGVIDITCYQCMKNFCFGCFENCEIDQCKCCEKVYCNDCNKVHWCEVCSKASCKACDVVNVCTWCSLPLCSDCASWVTCQKCGDRLCDECSLTCSYCQKSYCETCNECLFCGGPGCMASGAVQKASCDDCNKLKICAQQYCEEWSCEDCATSWLDCQYCSKSYCSINCGHDYVLDCQGEGCKRANCYDTHLGKYCTKEGEELGAECVRRCNAWKDGCPVTEKGCGTTYCTDCRVKALKRGGFNCSVCVESVAPLLDDA